MDSQEKQALNVLRRISNAGIADCRQALNQTGGDLCSALRSLMSDEHIRIAIADRRIREGDRKQSLTGAFSAKEGEILARLDAALRFEARAAKESVPTPGEAFVLPQGFASHEELVQFFQRTMNTVHGHDAFVEACKQRGIAESDLGYILDRMEGGAFRAAMAQAGAVDMGPNSESDPIAHAKFNVESKPRPWWRFWKR